MVQVEIISGDLGAMQTSSSDWSDEDDEAA
jgi:hypothetical protein